MNKFAHRKGLFITGTDTGVGKTFIGTQIVALLHENNINAVPRKPIESGCKYIDNKLMPEDAYLYFKAATKKFSLADICTYRFEPAISPQRAARLINQPVYLDDVAEACTKHITGNDYLIVEGAGGFYSPLCENGRNADLAKRLNLPVLLVAEDKLGCINHILLTVEAINNQGLTLNSIILNQQNYTQDQSMNNFDDLKLFIDIPIFIIKQNETFTNNKHKSQALLNKILYV